MAINKIPVKAFTSGDLATDVFTATAGQTAFTLSLSATSNSVIVSVNDVIQAPTTDYSVNGTTLTFTSGLTLSDEVIVRIIARPSTLNTVEDGAISSAKLATGAIEGKLGYTPVSPTTLTSTVNTAVANLVNSAPSTLDTLSELATALGNNANFATTVTTSLASKANISSLAAVATSGSYTDLINKPTVTPAGISDQVNTSTGYFALPVGTTAQRPATGSAGQLRFNTDLKGLDFYDGTSWQNLSYADPYWSNVVLYLRGGSLTDLKGRHTISAVNVSTSTAPGKPFSNAASTSWYYINNGTNNYLDVAGNLADFSPAGYTNFTIEFWLYSSQQNASYGHFYNIGGQSANGVIKFSGSPGSYSAYWYSSAGESINWGTTGYAFAGQWAHLVYEKYGTTQTTWVNGNRVSQNTNALPSGTPPYLRLGGPFSTEYSGHYFDELRVTTAARYKGVSTIPIQTQPWSTS